MFTSALSSQAQVSSSLATQAAVTVISLYLSTNSASVLNSSEDLSADVKMNIDLDTTVTEAFLIDFTLFFL